MLQLGFLTLCYNVVYSDWCLESNVGVRLVSMSGKEELILVPTETETIHNITVKWGFIFIMFPFTFHQHTHIVHINTYMYCMH